MSSKGHRIVNKTSKELCRKFNLQQVGSAFRYEDKHAREVFIRKSDNGWLAFVRESEGFEVLATALTMTLLMAELSR